MVMKKLSRNVSGIDRSPIRFILDRAARYDDVIELEIGQPDFPTPAHVIEAAVEAARHEYTGYTANAGMLELREAIVAKLARENDLHVTSDNVIVTVGAMQAVFASMAVVLDGEDEILLPDPGYGNFTMASRILNCVPRTYPTLAEQDFVPDFDAMEAMVTPRTKAMLVNSPSNPTGAVYSEETLRACLDFCKRHDLYLISDETYDRLVFEGRHYSPACWDEDGRVISIFTVSKSYAMTGWRVGYAIASKDIIASMIKIQEPIVSCVNTVAQHAAIAALLGPQDCVKEMLDQYRSRRDLVVALCEREGLSVSYPHGAFYVLVDISNQPENSMDFACGLLEAEHVAVAPGSSFGTLCERYVRLSLCCGEEPLTEGITRLARYLRQVSSRTVTMPARPASRAV
jgi:aspartate/methionine/tyrosine aminotransferase